jgi:L-glyceraldehyde 3-phosphate reductase
MSQSLNPNRYDTMIYRACGKSGLKLPVLSLGLWQNFGQEDNPANARQMIRTAFEAGITHFDLANNYGPPPGAAETFFGQILHSDLASYRDELVISTKAGHDMWPGPYGDGGSRKYVLASLDQSLKRMKLDYVDIFYSHRPVTDTPLEETLTALADAARMGKALYVGISKYPPETTRKAAQFLRNLNCPFIIHQPRYSMLDRTIEKAGLLDTLEDLGLGCIPFSPLAQGLLTDKYLSGSIPTDSRAGKDSPFLKAQNITPELVAKLKALNDIAKKRGQSLSQMAIAWLLRDPRITSVLVGASRPQQVADNLKALSNITFSDDELNQIETVLR